MLTRSDRIRLYTELLHMQPICNKHERKPGKQTKFYVVQILEEIKRSFRRNEAQLSKR